VPQSSPHAAAHHELFVKLLSDCLTETLYMASMAELHCDIISTASSLVLKGCCSAQISNPDSIPHCALQHPSPEALPLLCMSSILSSAVSGFSDKACLLLETVVKTLFDPAQYLTEGAVERQSELLKRQYSNANLKSSEAAATCRLLAIAPMRHSSGSKLTALLGWGTSAVSLQRSSKSCSLH
jgi:hypothetical protein